MNNALIAQPHIAKNFFGYTLLSTFLLKAFLAAIFPMTGDEAFFNLWGVDPAWGYSDHPPMIGWWLALLNAVHDHPLVLRSFTVVVTSLIALLIVDLLSRLLPPAQVSIAWWMGAIYLVMPWSWLFILVTTDTPLILFMALAVWSLVRAEAEDSRKQIFFYACAGLFLGLAFLSKYFAALLGIAFAVYVVMVRRHRWWALLCVFVCALPFVLLNLAFNALNGWPNILFNFINRHEQSEWQWQTLLTYIVMVVYLFTPWLVWRGAVTQTSPASNPRKLLLYLWVVPLLFFLLVSFKRSVGLHWLLGFVPVFMLWLGLSLQTVGARFKHFWAWTLALSAPHLVFVLVLALGPLSIWQGGKLYEKVVFLRESAAITQHLQNNIAQGEQLMAVAYSPAAILSYHHKNYVPVFGTGRHHARQDDLSFDFRDLQGRSVRIFDRRPFKLDDYRPYFESVEQSSFNVEGVEYFMLSGKGFQYQPYRDHYLVSIAQNFYQLPSWLPVWGQTFCERYALMECTPQPNVRK